MKKTSIAQFSSAIFLLAATFIVPGTALAQSGSRLCGYYTNMGNTTGAMQLGILYEARDNDATYTRQCDTVVDEVWKAIQADQGTPATATTAAIPKLSTYTWEKAYKATCESVGGNFTSTSHSSSDMCDSMSAKTTYKILKAPTATVTSRCSRGGCRDTTTYPIKTTFTQQ